MENSNLINAEKKNKIDEEKKGSWTFAEFLKVANASSGTLKKALEKGEIPGSFKLGCGWRVHKGTFYEAIKTNKFIIESLNKDKQNVNINSENA